MKIERVVPIPVKRPQVAVMARKAAEEQLSRKVTKVKYLGWVYLD